MSINWNLIKLRQEQWLFMISIIIWWKKILLDQEKCNLQSLGFSFKKKLSAVTKMITGLPPVKHAAYTAVSKEKCNQVILKLCIWSNSLKVALLFVTCFSCDSGGDCECLCTAIATYAEECNRRGVYIHWRSQELCRTLPSCTHAHTWANVRGTLSLTLTSSSCSSAVWQRAGLWSLWSSLLAFMSNHSAKSTFQLRCCFLCGGLLLSCRHCPTWWDRLCSVHSCDV